MRASEALMLGSTLLKPLMGTWYQQDSSGEEYGCAMGMIQAGLAGTAGGYSPLAIPEWMRYPWGRRLPCDCTGDYVTGSMGLMNSREVSEYTVQNTVVHLFNYHVMQKEDWTIERIADWLHSVEPAEQPDTREKRTILQAALEEAAVIVY